MASRKRKVEPLRAIIPGVLRESARKRRPLMAIQRDWGRFVGEELAGHTKPVSLHRGRLIVHVEAPGDSFAFSYRRTEVLKRLQTRTKGRVQEIVLRPGEI